MGKEDILKRRLSTIVSGKKLASTPKEARQMIVHKRVLVNGRLMNVPSYLVGFDEEDKIEIKKKAKKMKAMESSAVEEA